MIEIPRQLIGLIWINLHVFFLNRHILKPNAHQFALVQNEMSPHSPELCVSSLFGALYIYHILVCVVRAAAAVGGSRGGQKLIDTHSGLRRGPIKRAADLSDVIWRVVCVAPRMRALSHSINHALYRLRPRIYAARAPTPPDILFMHIHARRWQTHANLSLWEFAIFCLSRCEWIRTQTSVLLCLPWGKNGRRFIVSQSIWLDESRIYHAR